MAYHSQFNERECTCLSVDLSPFTKLYRPENIRLYKLFEREGYELRIAGAGVCDLLLDVEPDRIEYAVYATPNQLKEMCQKYDIRIFSRREENFDHFALLVDNRFNFCITTVRNDASPSRSTGMDVCNSAWKRNAAKREFTVTAMFITLDLSTLPENSRNTLPHCVSREHSANQHATSVFKGCVYDYYGGLQDVQNRRVRFVGDPSIRMRESPIKILRYFLFHGHVVRPAEWDVHDPEILKAVVENVAALDDVPGDRCWTELRRILHCHSAPLLFRRMSHLGILPYLGFQWVPDFPQMDAAWARGILRSAPDPATCLATLVSNLEQAAKLFARLQLNTLERKIMCYIIRNRERCAQIPENVATEYFRRKLLLSGLASRNMHKVMMEMMKYLAYDVQIITEWSTWVTPKFPVTRKDVADAWSIPRREIRFYLYALRRQWVDSNCLWKREDLLSTANRAVVEDLVRRLSTELFL
ncbi:unnamed protein product [Dicrocoelium dendriticum]|nr:unnamed protein product [Dicrocoelium dendriticum]